MDIIWNLIDILLLILIFAVSYWIAFASGASKYFKKSKHRRHQKGEALRISGKETVANNPFKKCDVLIIYRKECENSNNLVNLINEKSSLECELFDAEGYDFEALEFLEIPVIFALDRCEKLFEFLMLKEKDSKNVRAYRRRHLNNIRYAVLDVGDGAFAEFIDQKLKDSGAIQVLEVEKNFEECKMDQFIESFENKL